MNFFIFLYKEEECLIKNHYVKKRKNYISSRESVLGKSCKGSL